ncbi:MAG: hypothetical protein R2873_12935 [Caldilineaceae bacterium]
MNQKHLSASYSLWEAAPMSRLGRSSARLPKQHFAGRNRCGWPNQCCRLPGSHLAWEGGIAGFCDDLAIYTTGQAVATSCSGVASDIALSDAQLGQLYAWLDTLQSFEVKQNDPAGAADAMQITLLFDGRGDRAATADEQQAILDFVIGIAPQRSGAADQSNAVAVVDAFLLSLQTEPSGSNSNIFLSRRLQAEVATGKPTSTLLGIQNLVPTFTLSLQDGSNISGVAIVTAELAYAVPYALQFHLVLEDGEWRIDEMTNDTAAYQSPSEQECERLRQTVANLLGADVALTEAAFSDDVQGTNGTGCQLMISFSGEVRDNFVELAGQLQDVFGGSRLGNGFGVHRRWTDRHRMGDAS